MKAQRLVIALLGLAALNTALSADDSREHLKYAAGRAMIDIIGWDSTGKVGAPVARFQPDDLHCAAAAVKAVNRALEQTPEFRRFADIPGYLIQIDVVRRGSTQNEDYGLKVNDKEIYVKSPLYVPDHFCVMNEEFSHTIAEQMRSFIRNRNVAELKQQQKTEAVKDLEAEMKKTSQLLDIRNVAPNLRESDQQ
jgi:hypothetical protein